MLKRIETTYKDFCDTVAKNPNKQYYVKNHLGELVPIRACGKKISDTWIVEFDNGYIIEAADRHAFMNMNGESLFVEDLQPGDKIKTVNGYITVKARHTHKNQQDVYDINIDAPHWYTNDDVGIIHHNTLYSLVCAKAYLDKYDDSVLLFYDSEMGASQAYFESLEIDPQRVLHVPVTDVEQLKFDIMSQLEEIKRGDHVIIVVDSIGNLASKKEVEDALNEKSAADMTRAKQLKSLTRMVTPHLNLKNIPMIIINHIYMDMGLFPKAITGGGSGLIYASDNILLISRSQEKKGTDIVGYNFNINVMKSRHSREKARIPVTVTYNNGINVWSGLLEMAVASGDVIKPSNGWYQVVDPETGEMIGNKIRAADTNTREFWEPILKREHFRKWIRDNFGIANNKLLADNATDDQLQPNSEFTMEE